MLSDTFLRTITLTNRLTLNMLEAKVTLSPKTTHNSIIGFAEDAHAQKIETSSSLDEMIDVVKLM